MLFVSVQQSNIELCIQYAINRYVMFLYCWWDLTLAFISLVDKIRVISTVCPHPNLNDCNAKFASDGYGVVYNNMVWASICEWKPNSLNWLFTLYSLFMKKSSVSANRQCVSACHLWKLLFVNFYLRVPTEADDKKSYVKPIIIFTCAVWDWHVVQNVSLKLCWIMAKIRLMECCWQYVCGFFFGWIIETR